MNNWFFFTSLIMKYKSGVMFRFIWCRNLMMVNIVATNDLRAIMSAGIGIIDSMNPIFYGFVVIWYWYNCLIEYLRNSYGSCRNEVPRNQATTSIFYLMCLLGMDIINQGLRCIVQRQTISFPSWKCCHINYR